MRLYCFAFANIVDQVPDSRIRCSCYGSRECCKKHTEICGMHSFRFSAGLDDCKLEKMMKDCTRTPNPLSLISRPQYISTG